MKRLLLCLALLFLGCALSSSALASIEKSVLSQLPVTVSNTDVVFEASTGGKIGKNVQTSFADITIEGLIVEKGELQYIEGKWKHSFDHNDDLEYIVLVFSIKNKSGHDFCTDFGGNCIIDGVSYSMKSYVCKSGKGRNTISGSDSNIVLLVSEAPIGTYNKSNSVYYHIGFNENFSMSKMNYNDSDYRYVVRCKVSASDSYDEIYTIGNKDLPHSMNVEVYDAELTDYVNEIKNEFALIKFEEFGVVESYAIRFSPNTAGGYLFDEEGSKYIYVLASYKNLSKKGATPYISGTLTVDGYEYELDIVNKDPQSDFFANFSKTVSVAPLHTSYMFIYASVPDELAESFTTCKFDFVIPDMFEAGDSGKSYIFEYKQE